MLKHCHTTRHSVRPNMSFLTTSLRVTKRENMENISSVETHQEETHHIRQEKNGILQQRVVE